MSRALSLATVMLLMGAFSAGRALAQENLDAGKSPSQIFAGTCSACHRSPRSLLKTVPPGSLSSFLRQHYTTSPAMAATLASYLISNGAADTRQGGASPKGAKEEARQEARRGQDQPRTAAKPEDGQVPAQAVVEHGPDGRKLSAKQRFSKRGRPGAEEPPKAEEPPAGEAPKEAAKEAAAKEAAKESVKEEAKPEAAKPGDSPSQSAKVEQPSETPVMRPDPVPPVTPALPAPSSTPAADLSNAAEAPAVPLPSQPAPPPQVPEVTAAAPPLPPVPPAGPPAPPISQ